MFASPFFLILQHVFHDLRYVFLIVVASRPSGTGRMAKSDYEHHVFFFHVHWFTNGNPIRPMDEIFILADNHLKLIQELVIQSVQLLHDLFVGNKLDSALSKSLSDIVVFYLGINQ